VRRWNPKPPTRLRRDAHARWLDDVRGPAVLVEAGVVVAAGSSGRTSKVLLEGVAVARDEGGLSDEDALDILTQGAHAAYGLDPTQAEVRAGAPAFLTAWSDAPLVEGCEARVLVVDGVLFDLREPHARVGIQAPDDDSGESRAERDEVQDPAKTADDEPVDDVAAVPSSDADDRDVLEWPVELDQDREPSFRTGGSVLVRGATILTASHGTLEATDMLVLDGRIDSLGPGLVAPEGVHVVEASGLYLIPGIIDCHSHAAIRGGVNEWTRVVTPEVSIEDEVDPEDVNVYRALAGGVTARACSTAARTRSAGGTR
jgi:imidazolonepropionase-like amidohydrolase